MNTFASLIASVDRRRNPRDRNPQECARRHHAYDGQTITLWQFSPPRCGYCGSDLLRPEPDAE